MENKELEFTPTESDFELVQRDDIIYDQKFETKTTTFAKDALKRFCKNKSSVVGAFIIGFLMVLALIVPLVSPYNIDEPDPQQTLLVPKLFKAGTGFWDGTKVYEDVAYNAETESPEGFKKAAVVEILELNTEEYVNLDNADQTSYKSTAFGGYYKFLAEPSDSSTTKRLENRKPFTITADGGYYVEYTFGNEAHIESGASTSDQAEYRISIVTGKEGASTSKKVERAILSDWSSDYSTRRFDLSQAVKDLGLAELADCSIKLEIKTNKTTYTHVLIEKIIIGATNVTDEDELKLLKTISMDNACEKFFLKKNDAGVYPEGYYSCSGITQVHQAKTAKCKFVYDLYADKLGLQTNFIIGGTEMNQYIANGWCSYDFEVGPSSFVKLSDECPIEAVYEQSEGTGDFKGYFSLTTDTVLYKYKGYDKMPTYIFGTTDKGFDIIKLSFVGLRTSLLVAIMIAAVNLCIGLIWGSISGYFGGNVDLIMERITDILSNIPFIVVLTLIVLHFGRGIGTFAVAMVLTGWIGTAARTRTQFYRFKGREYVLASRTLGASDKRLIFKHILPNALGTIVTSSVLMIPGAIFSEASVSYLGLGLQGVKSFGVILSENQAYLQTYPALIVFPAVIISLLMISFNLFGNGLRDALNPSLKGSE